MANILDYLDWRGDLSLTQSPFNPVDNLILSQMSYLMFNALVPGFTEEVISVSIGEASKHLLAQDPVKNPTLTPQNRALLQKMAYNARFRHANLFFYCNDRDTAEEKQFSAITISLEDQSVYVAFRGTDSTITGWKEDFNLAFTCPVPAQTEAVRYLKQVASLLPCHLRVGGHSKGGNLAVYAASSCPIIIQERIIQVYNNDGPGLDASFLESPGYQRVQPRIHTFLPQSSIIGMLLEHREAYTIIHSSRAGLMQHDPYSWQVLGADFERAKEFTPGSQFIDQTLNQWVSSMDIETRRVFIDTLYRVLEATGAERLDDLTENWQSNAFSMLDALKNTDKQTRKLIREVISVLFRTMKTQFKQTMENHSRHSGQII